MFKAFHIWHADAEWLAPRMFPQLPPLLGRVAMEYAAGAFKSPNMCNTLTLLKATAPTPSHAQA